MGDADERRVRRPGGLATGLAAGLGVAVAADVVLALWLRGPAGLLTVSGQLACGGAALLALRHATVGAIAGMLAVGASTVLLAVLRTVPPGILPGFGVTEAVAGCLLVLLVVWRGGLVASLLAPTGLVLAGMTALALRLSLAERPALDAPSFVQSLLFGFVLLLVMVTAGLTLRRRDRPDRSGEDSPGRELLRRQWPVVVALGGLLVLEAAITVLDRPIAAVTVAGSAAVCVLAGLAPRDPVRCALLGAGCHSVTSVGVAVAGIAPPIVPMAGGAALLVLAAFAVRLAAPAPAALSAVAVGAAGVTTVVALLWRPGRGLGDQLSGTLAFGTVLLTLAIGAGLYFRARDADRARVAAAVVERAQQTERMALARELHDIVAHHVTGIVVHANAVRTVAEPGPARDALGRISDSGTEALVAMRRLVGGLRATEHGAEQATTDLAADLHAVAGRSVVPVGLELTLPERVPEDVARSVLRLVTEAVTNAGKHAAGATLVTVRVRPDSRGVEVRVADDGRGARPGPPGGSGGYGLVGMAERVELLGGRFHAGPGSDTGWRVEAWLPCGEGTR